MPVAIRISKIEQEDFRKDVDQWTVLGLERHEALKLVCLTMFGTELKDIRWESSTDGFPVPRLRVSESLKVGDSLPLPNPEYVTPSDSCGSAHGNGQLALKLQGIDASVAG